MAAGLGCRVTTAWHALTGRAQIQAGEWLAVHGTGGIGLSALLADNFLRYDGNGDVPSQIHTYLSSNFHDLRNLEKSDPRL